MRRIETDQSCERCGGTGKIEGYGKCIRCGGHGSIRVIKWISTRDYIEPPEKEMKPNTDYRNR